MGYTVVELPVSHRARAHGETKYGAGVLTRALPGLIDCFAVRWMGSRRRPVDHESPTADPTANHAETVTEGARA